MNYLQINEQDLISNIETLKKNTSLKLIGVVKGNGYGFGLTYMADLLVKHGITTLAVTELSDLLALRAHGIEEDILLLKPVVTMKDAERLCRAKGIATISSFENAELLNAAVNSCLEAGRTNGEEDALLAIRAHIKINTGLNRFGFSGDFAAAAEKLKQYSHIAWEGIYTHFNSAFTSTEETIREYRALLHAAALFEKQGFDFREIHCADTSAFMNLGKQIEKGMTAVRIGSGWSGRAISNSQIQLRKVGTFVTQVLEVRHLAKGEKVGYSGAFSAKQEMDVAVIGAGYDDGVGKHVENGAVDEGVFWHEWLSGVKAHLRRRTMTVRIQDRDCTVLGFPGMTNISADVTGLSVKAGDEVRMDIAPIHVNPLLPREIG